MQFVHGATHVGPTRKVIFDDHFKKNSISAFFVKTSSIDFSANNVNVFEHQTRFLIFGTDS